MTEQINATSLQNYVERIERLNNDKAEVNVNIREVYAQAKAEGYDPKMIREIIKLRKIEEKERELMDETLETYRNALNV